MIDPIDTNYRRPLQDPDPLKENPIPEPPPYRSSIPELGCIEIHLIQSILKREEKHPRIVQNLYAQGENYVEKMGVLSEQRMEKARENAQYAIDAEGWGVFRTVGEGLVTIISVAMGFSMMQQGNSYLGAALMFVGLLELFNLIYSRTRLWEDFAKKCSDDPEVQRDIIKYAPMIISAIATAANFAGTYYGLDRNSSAFSKTMMTGLLGIGLFCQGIGSLADGVVQGKMTWAETVIEKISTDESLTQALVGSLNAFVDNILEIGQQSAKICNKCIHHSTNIKTKILQTR